jgi:hypothetical protein
MPKYLSPNFTIDVGKFGEYGMHMVLLNPIAVACLSRYVKEVAAFVIDYIMVCN